MFFARVCDVEFTITHIGVNLFSLHLCVCEYMLNILCEKGTEFVSRCWGLLLEDFGAIARSFDKSRKLIRSIYITYHMHF